LQLSRSGPPDVYLAVAPPRHDPSSPSTALADAIFDGVDMNPPDKIAVARSTGAVVRIRGFISIRSRKFNDWANQKGVTSRRCRLLLLSGSIFADHRCVQVKKPLNFACILSLFSMVP
jgi:hypothetical protein